MTKTLNRRLALLVVLLLGLCAATSPFLRPAVGQDAGGDTSAVAINTRDGSSLFKLAFQVRRVTGEVVDNQNAAVAYASCNECQTVAISIQVLLIAGSPTVFSPTNVALAINEQCTLCDTMALAYQFAIGMNTKLRFTAEGNRQLAQLRRRLEQLRTSGLSNEEIQAQATEIMDQLSEVLSSELVAIHPEAQQAPPTGDDEEEAGSEPPQTSPEPAPPAETTPSDPTETAPTTDPTDAEPPNDAAETAPETGETQTGPPASTTPAP